MRSRIEHRAYVVMIGLLRLVLLLLHVMAIYAGTSLQVHKQSALSGGINLI